MVLPRAPAEAHGADASEAATPASNSRWHWLARLGWVPGVVLVVVLSWIVVEHVAEEREIAILVEQAQPLWLLAAAVLQVFSYITAAEAIRAPLAISGHAPPRRKLIRLAVLKLTLDQLVPSGGFSGTLLVLRRLRALGVPPPIVASTFVVESVAYYLAYALAVVMALTVLWAHHDLSPWIVGVAGLFAVLAISIPLGGLAFVLRHGRLVPAWMTRFEWVRVLVSETSDVDRSLLVQPSAFAKSALASFATITVDSLTLTATMLAVGADLAPLVGFAGLVMGSVAATIGIVPGGLGTFETATVGVLVLLGLGPVQALGATLLLRLFTFWLPMFVGVVMYQRDRRRAGAQHAASA